jgi:hypothetical protein
MFRKAFAPLAAALLLATGCAKDAPPCKGDAVLCGAACADLHSDNANCGACGNGCAAGKVCSNGACEVTCAAGLVNCGGKCVDPLKDRDHCGATGTCEGGAAGTACGPGQVCAAGACATSCPPGELDCGGKCVDPQTDRSFCGADAACGGGASCGPGNYCVAGACVGACPTGYQPCGAGCVNPSSDPNYCGADAACNGGTVCGPGAACYQGRCWSLCPAGQVVCDGACVDPRTDAGHCGANGYCTGANAGAACGTNQVCDAGACTDWLATAEGFCDTFLDAYGSRFVSCGYGDVAYLGEFVAKLKAGCAPLAEAVAAGRVAYDRALAVACMARFALLPCDGTGFMDAVRACEAATPGLIAVGGTCQAPSRAVASDCVDGARCDSSATCPGVCVAPGTAYGPCEPSKLVSKCVDGHYCSTVAVVGPPAFPAGTCLPLPTTVGARCDGDAGRRCGGGLACAYDPKVPGYKCVGPAGPGDDCSLTGYGCVAGYYCRYLGASAPTYACRVIPTSPGPVGTDCFHGGASDCQAGLVCDWNAGSTCAAPLADGSTCSNTSTPCATTSVCALSPWAASGTCTARKAANSSCTVGFDECAYGLYCKGPGSGASGTCVSGHSAIGGTCGFQVAVSDPACTIAPCSVKVREYVLCDRDGYCPLATYEAPGTCRAYGAVGESCASPSSDACGDPWTGLVCDEATKSCASNSCSLLFGPFTLL